MNLHHEQANKQFKTVIAGYRLHGLLFSTQNQLSQIFILKVQSSSHNKNKYQILFDQNILAQSSLNEQFENPQSVYDYLSKFTKFRIKFNIQKEIMNIIVEKNKSVKQFCIELQSGKIDISKNIKIDVPVMQITQQKSFIEIIQQQPIIQIIQQQPFIQITQQNPRQQPKVCQAIHQKQKTESSNSLLTETTQTYYKIQQPIDFEMKIQQLKKKNDPKQQPILIQATKQMVQISYKFNTINQKQQNLYQFAFNCKLKPLVQMIQANRLHLDEEISFKKLKLQIIPPFQQIILSNLKNLSLQVNYIKKIQNLNFIPNLQKINLDGNQITRIQNLQALTKLKSLKLGNNKILTIQKLQTLQNLQVLWLDFNEIQKIQNLNKLKKLKSLNLSFNTIRKLQNLSQLQSLEQLLINQNQISQIQNLQNLTQLARLSLNFNSISIIQGVRKLFLLENFNICQNQIQYLDKQAFQQLNWLKMLKQLKLNGNYIQKTQQTAKYIQRFSRYGTKITI